MPSSYSKMLEQRKRVEDENQAEEADIFVLQALALASLAEDVHRLCLGHAGPILVRQQP